MRAACGVRLASFRNKVTRVVHDLTWMRPAPLGEICRHTFRGLGGWRIQCVHERERVHVELDWTGLMMQQCGSGVGSGVGVGACRIRSVVCGVVRWSGVTKIICYTQKSEPIPSSDR